MRLREKISNLQALSENESTKASARRKAAKAIERLESASRHRRRERRAELNRQNDRRRRIRNRPLSRRSYYRSLPRVRIIHGFGTGALKNFVHHFLKGHPHIEKFASRRQTKGGQGATIAELKQ
jgi:DNA mismatch repair protein MutS2